MGQDNNSSSVRNRPLFGASSVVDSDVGIGKVANFSFQVLHYIEINQEMGFVQVFPDEVVDFFALFVLVKQKLFYRCTRIALRVENGLADLITK